MMGGVGAEEELAFGLCVWPANVLNVYDDVSNARAFVSTGVTGEEAFADGLQPPRPPLSTSAATTTAAHRLQSISHSVATSCVDTNSVLGSSASGR